MKLSDRGIEIELEFDREGFPIITIDTQDGYHDKGRPTVEVNLSNGQDCIMIHEMFDEDDARWRDDDENSA